MNKYYRTFINNVQLVDTLVLEMDESSTVVLTEESIQDR